MLSWIEPMLYIDEQAKEPVILCPQCAGECYGPSLRCLRCERRQP